MVLSFIQAKEIGDFGNDLLLDFFCLREVEVLVRVVLQMHLSLAGNFMGGQLQLSPAMKIDDADTLWRLFGLSQRGWYRGSRLVYFLSGFWVVLNLSEGLMLVSPENKVELEVLQKGEVESVLRGEGVV